MAFNKAKALQDAHKYVAQGKTAPAIKQYQWIIDKDPIDLTLLNVIGDLYAQDNNIPEALKYFYKLGGAYSREGYKVKAVAIYKKISKLDRNAAEPLLKLAELNASLGLAHEAREQYKNAFELFDRIGQKDKALEILRELCRLDPNSPALRLKLAQYVERAGETREAGDVYFEAAVLAHQGGDAPTGELALSKATELAPENPKVHLYRARQALANQKPEEVKRILDSNPELLNDPQAQRLLLESYLAARNPEAARGLLLEVFHSDPSDFSPVADFAEGCIKNQQYEAALEALNAVTPDLLARREAGPLMAILRRLWKLSPEPMATLELAYRVAEKTADEAMIPEIIEALGNAQVQSEQLEKAEQTFARLVAREPENETYKDLLQQVLKKQCKQYVPLGETPFIGTDVGLEAEPEPARDGAVGGPDVDSEQAAIVKGAITNSDFFVRDGLTERAVEELERVLGVYPEQVNIHKRIVEVCREKLPARAVQAAEVLTRVYLGRGESGEAKRYHEEALELAQTAATIQASPSTPSERSGQVPSGEKSEQLPALLVIDFSRSHDGEQTPEKEEVFPAPQEISLEFKTSQVADRPTTDSATSQETFAGKQSSSGLIQHESAREGAPDLNYEESREEIEFYLRHGFLSEADKAASELKTRYPEEAQVAELQQFIDQSSRGADSAERFQTAQGTEVEAGDGQEWVLPTSFSEKAEAPGWHEPEEHLTGEPASAMAELHDPTIAPASPTASHGQTANPRSAEDASHDLGSLLDELDDGNEPIHQTADDEQTHYNLGVAFREMGLLDEAIGEFQKAVKGGGSERSRPNFLQGCTLLACCFMDKGMPAIAAKWYLRALEAPGLDHEGVLAIYYDLGIAFEKAGNTMAALEKFTEACSQNIDYRDVAEEIRLLRGSPC